MDRPWDEWFVDCMQQTALKLCENIQCAVFGYVQSDEISILLIDWNKYNTTQFFDGKIQKICSIAASMATAHFNNGIKGKYSNKTGMFDARVFNIPEHDVVNNFLWRQQDCTRNSIQMLARSQFSHKECHRKNTSQLQDMLMEKGINWNDIPTHLKRGTAIVRKKLLDNEFLTWTIDKEMPILSQNKEYVQIPKRFGGEQ